MKAVNKIKVMLGIGILMFGGNAVASTETSFRVEHSEKELNRHIQHTGTDWYFEHRYGVPTKEYQELWLKYVNSEEKYKPKIKEWLSQKISQEKLKQALKKTSPLNKNTSKTLSQDEIQALKTETQALRQQFANYIAYATRREPNKLYQDKFRFLYNRSKDLIILMIDNKVKDKELLEITLEYRKALEEEFLEENRMAGVIYADYELNHKAKNLKRGDPKINEIRAEIQNSEGRKKFDIIAEQYKGLNENLQKYIELQNVKIVN